MPIDPMIARGIDRVQMPDPLETLQTINSLRTSKMQNELMGYKMDSARQEQMQAQALRELLASNPDFADPVIRSRLTTLGEQGRGIVDSLDKQQKSRLDNAKLTDEHKRRFASFIAQNPGKWRVAYDAYSKLTGEGDPDDIAMFEEAEQEGPEAVAELARSVALDVKDTLPKTGVVDTGGQQMFTNTDPITGQVTSTGRVNKTLSPEGNLRVQLETDPSLVASSTTDNAGNVTHFNKRGQVIGTTAGAGKPSATFEKTRVAREQMGRDIGRLESELAEITKDGGLIDQSTGSGAGALRDATARFFGEATEGNIAVGKLQPIADMALKMVPRFEGPQSDKDTQSYREAAGQLADPAMPNKIKKAAGKEILRLLRARKGQFTVEGVDETIDTPAPSTGGVKFLGFE